MPNLSAAEVLSETVSMVIVRHPLSRLVSAYYNKFVTFTGTSDWNSYRLKALKQRPGGDLIIKDEGGKVPAKTVFDEFDPHLPT